MSYLLIHVWPNGTEEQYRATLAAVHPDGALPAGQVHHAAGPSDEGYLVSTEWASKAECDAFLEKMLAGPPPEGGFQGPPQQYGGEISNLQQA